MQFSLNSLCGLGSVVLWMLEYDIQTTSISMLNQWRAIDGWNEDVCGCLCLLLTERYLTHSYGSLSHTSCTCVCVCGVCMCVCSRDVGKSDDRCFSKTAVSPSSEADLFCQTAGFLPVPIHTCPVSFSRVCFFLSLTANQCLVHQWTTFSVAPFLESDPVPAKRYMALWSQRDRYNVLESGGVHCKI